MPSSSVDPRGVQRGRRSEQDGAANAGAHGPAAGKALPERGGLVTVDCLAGIPDGGRLALPPGGMVTPLAREEAWRRGIQLGSGGAGSPPGASGAVSTTPGDQRSGRDPHGAASLRVAIGSDHGGFELKAGLIAALRELGHRPQDMGTRDPVACDYPDYARAVAEAVSCESADFGICIDGAGIGSAMAAGKVAGVLAANCWNEASAHNAREHNYANVLTLGAGHLSEAQAEAIVRSFLATPQGAARHGRRVHKIQEIEDHYSRGRSRTW